MDTFPGVNATGARTRDARRMRLCTHARQWLVRCARNEVRRILAEADGAIVCPRQSPCGGGSFAGRGVIKIGPERRHFPWRAFPKHQGPDP